MTQVDLRSGVCPVGRAAEVVGDRWVLLIMRNAMLGARRFDDFRRDLGIADNILSNRLSRMVDAGLLVKEPYLDSGHTRMHYRLTRAGAELRPVLESLAAWGLSNVNPDHPAEAVRTVHRACGNFSADGRYCATCRTAITDETVAWRMPWLSPDPIPLAAWSNSTVAE